MQVKSFRAYEFGFRLWGLEVRGLELRGLSVGCRPHDKGT